MPNSAFEGQPLNRYIVPMANLLFFPGIGGNELLFSKQLKVFPQAQVPTWLPPKPRESLADYARRWAPHFPKGPSVLVGMSFGGMMALELSQHLSTQAVLILASPWNRDGVSERFRSMQRLSPWIPDWALAIALTQLGPHTIAKRQGLGLEELQWLKQMAAKVDLSFARWQCFAACGWQGLPSADAAPNYLTAFHGRKDKVIPLLPARFVEPIEDGGHFLLYTHAQKIQQWIEKALGASL